MSRDKTSESMAICDTVVFYVHSKGFVRPAYSTSGQSIHASRGGANKTYLVIPTPIRALSTPAQPLMPPPNRGRILLCLRALRRPRPLSLLVQARMPG